MQIENISITTEQDSINGNMTISVKNDVLFVDCTTEEFFRNRQKLVSSEIIKDSNKVKQNQGTLEGELIFFAKEIKRDFFAFINNMGELIIIDRKEADNYSINANCELEFNNC